jgi:hypothetical protein
LAPILFTQSSTNFFNKLLKELRKEPLKELLKELLERISGFLGFRALGFRL